MQVDLKRKEQKHGTLYRMVKEMPISNNMQIINETDFERTAKRHSHSSLEAQVGDEERSERSWGRGWRREEALAGIQIPEGLSVGSWTGRRGRRGQRGLGSGNG